MLIDKYFEILVCNLTPIEMQKIILMFDHVEAHMVGSPWKSFQYASLVVYKSYRDCLASRENEPKFYHFTISADNP